MRSDDAALDARLLDLVPNNQMLQRVILRQVQLIVVNALAVLVVGVVADREA